MLQTAVSLLGSVWREGNTLIQEPFSRHLAKLQFVLCSGVQFEDGLVFFLPLSEQVKPQLCSAATPRPSCGGCRPGLSKECWILITFAPGMSPQWLPWFIPSRKSPVTTFPSSSSVTFLLSVYGSLWSSALVSIPAGTPSPLLPSTPGLAL